MVLHMVLEVLAWLFACVVAAPSLVFAVECVLGALAKRSKRVAAAAEQPGPAARVAVLVPAHDESAGIGPALADLQPQLRAGDTLLVIADNCTDDTAALARAAGATVIERSDPERRGKGYALAFGIDHLAACPPDAVVIIDADCRVAQGGVARIADLAVRTDRPVQADYVLAPPRNGGGLAVVSQLAFIVKNRVRPRGLAVLGLPCLLTGTGMAFPWRVLRMAKPTLGNLVEDMVMGLDLALMGHPPLLCADAHVTSELPERTQAAHAQRRRWEHGHLATLLEHAPRLLLQGVLRARIDLIALSLDLAVPPLSLLAIAVLCALGATGLLAWLGASLVPFVVSALCLVGLSFGVFVAWLAYGRDTIPARQLLAIPRYVLWKLPLYFTFMMRGRHGSWERTERK